MQKILFFDLDGTVLNTLPDIAKSANYALDSLGFPMQSIEQVRKAIGHGIRNLLKDLMGCNDLETLERCREIFKEHYGVHKSDTTRPFEGIEQLLKELKAEGWLLALISNKYDGATKELAEEFFDGIFDGVFGSVDNIAAKPDKEIFDFVCAQMGISSSGIIYIGDSEVDCEFAKNCNMKFIGVDWGFRTNAQLKEAGAQVIASTPKELKELIYREYNF